MNLVTVVMPYFKKKNYVITSIKSVLAQTYKNFELIIVYDDEDMTDLEIIENIKKKDARIKIIVNSKNLGAGPSRNKAIEIARGDFLAFLDSDDIWEKKKIEIQIKFMLDNNFDFSSTSYFIIDEFDNIIDFRRTREIVSFSTLLKSCDVGLSTVMLKRKLITAESQFVGLKTKEDFVLWLNITKKNINIYGIDQGLCSWRKIKKSLSTNVFQKLFDGFLVYNKYMKFNLLKSLYYLAILSINYLKKRY
jgi:teichuronic acid biosynthesis glycosyltransferase TuaG